MIQDVRKELGDAALHLSAAHKELCESLLILKKIEQESRGINWAMLQSAIEAVDMATMLTRSQVINRTIEHWTKKEAKHGKEQEETE